jgi:hypothetical protein
MLLEKFCREHLQVLAERERVCPACEGSLKNCQSVRELDLEDLRQAEVAVAMLLREKGGVGFWALTAARFYQVASDAICEGDATRAAWASIGVKCCRPPIEEVPFS